MDNNKQCVDMLEDVLKKQLDTLCEILKVTKEQERIASEPTFDEESFDETLSKKDVLIIRLNELDNGFASIYGRVRSEVQNNPDMYREKIAVLQGLIRQCTDLGMEIQTLENRNKDKLAKCFASKKQEYSAKHTAANVANKYSRTMKNVNLMNGGYGFNLDK